jgi:hypothetical protein
LECRGTGRRGEVLHISTCPPNRGKLTSAGLTLHRLLEHEIPSERDFEPKLSRNQAKLRGVSELFRVSVSHWLEHDDAVRASERPRCFVARLEIPSGTLLRVALTEEWGHGHVDVWGHPQELLAAIADVGARAKGLDCGHDDVHRPREHSR